MFITSIFVQRKYYVNLEYLLQQVMLYNVASIIIIQKFFYHLLGQEKKTVKEKRLMMMMMISIQTSSVIIRKKFVMINQSIIDVIKEIDHFKNLSTTKKKTKLKF